MKSFFAKLSASGLEGALCAQWHNARTCPQGAESGEAMQETVPTMT